MATGIAINIGLNAVDPTHYRDGDGKPWPGTLVACENDANDLAALAQAQGFDVRGPLLTANATTTEVIARVTAAASELTAGDMLLLTYSGHGGQVENTNPEVDPEADGLDETWCLFDRQLIDDELFALFSKFAAGVRIVVLSDSCHSGTVTRFAPTPASAGDDHPAEKHLPMGVAVATEAAHRDAYAQVQASVDGAALSSMAATVVLISGCQDSQTSKDGRRNGTFTAALLQAWNDPNARKSLKDLWKVTAALIPKEREQDPNYVVYGFDISAPALAI